MKATISANSLLSMTRQGESPHLDFNQITPIYSRAATIVLRENNCHFLRVDKENFNRILRDVEANTVRLKEHGKDVLILEKINTPTKQIFSSHFK